MLTNLTRKDWGAMIPVDAFDIDGRVLTSRSWLAVIEGHRTTSIHQHDCSSTITVIEGCVQIIFGEDEAIVLTKCEQIEIPAGVKHMVSGITETSVLFETYSTVGESGEYDITRFDDWTEEEEVQADIE